MAKFFKAIKSAATKSVSALNGAVGDKLADTPLGIEMAFYAEGKKLVLDKKSLAQRHAAHTIDGAVAPVKICVLIHGLTHSETTWDFPDKSNYGTLLRQEKGYAPFYLRYNTGLHISENGKSLAWLMEKLCENYPSEVLEICIIAHSMGGLLTHSACHYAQENSLGWAKKIRHIFLLAAPHLGSFLEKAANVATNILEKVPNWPTRLVGQALNLRSDGIKDLRFGYITDEDWQGKDPDSLLKNEKKPVQKLADVSYYVISGRLTEDEKHWITMLFGDILVRSSSAAAKSENPQEFNFAPEDHYQFAKTNHFKLTCRPEVYEKIKERIEIVL